MKNLSPASLYESAYQKLQLCVRRNDVTPAHFNHSLIEFFNRMGRWNNHTRVLELGCGSDSLACYLGQPFARWLALDFSQTALSMARHNCQNKNVEFFNADVASNPILPWSGFDLVLDAHCLHCLTSKAAAVNMISWGLAQLNRGGQFLIESMIAGPELDLDFDFSWNGEQVLQRMQGTWQPVRLLLDADELNLLLKNIAATNGARLIYFVVDTQKTIALREDDENDGTGRPYCARAILQRF